MDAGIKQHPVFRMAACGELKQLKYVMRQQCISVDLKDESGRSLLHHAVKEDQIAVVRWLVKSGASISVVCAQRRSLFHAAAEYNALRCARLLLKQLFAAVAGQNPLLFGCFWVGTSGDDPMAEGTLDVLVGKDNEGSTPLHVAFRNRTGDCAKLYCKYLFRFVADPTSLSKVLQRTNGDGQTLFHIACANRSFACSQFLLDIDKAYEAALTCRKRNKLYGKWLKEAIRDMTTWCDRSGRTALIVLCVSSCSCAVGELLPFKKDDEKWSNQCCRQCKKESYDMVRLLYKHCRRIFSVRELDSGRTPLMVAAACGNLAMVHALCEEANANIEDTDCDDRTVLHLAAAKGIDAVVSYLINAVGASASVHDGDGYTPMHYATIHERVEVMETLHRANPQLLEVPSIGGHNSLMLAVLNNCVNSLYIILHLSPGTNRSQVDFYGNTAAILAARKNFPEVLSVLLAYQFDVEKLTEDGLSIMQVAIHYNSIAVLSIVHDALNLEQLDEDGGTLIHEAAERNETLPALKFLLACKEFRYANINKRDNLRRTALHVAVTGQAVECVKVLLNHNADVRAADVYGFDPFMHALEMDNAELTAILLGAGINENGLSIRGQTTTLSLARVKGNLVVARFLELNGALTFEQVQNICAKKIQRWFRKFLDARNPTPIAMPRITAPMKTETPSDGRMFRKRLSPQEKRKKCSTVLIKRRKSVADLVDVFERLKHLHIEESS